MGSIFDKNELGRVPVTIEVNGQKKVVGEAQLYEGGQGFIHAEMDLKTDDPNEVIDLFKGGITGVSIADDDSFVQTEQGKHVKSEMDIQLEAGIPVHDHKPVQHRDAKPAWCPRCGLTADYQQPSSRTTVVRGSTGLHFGTPDRPNLRRGE
jgi:hypothetical protein